MGKSAAFVKERLGEIHRRKVARTQHTLRLKHKRRGDDNTDRLVQRVQSTKPLPTDEDTKLLLDQVIQACRLPTPADDLCRILDSSEKTFILQVARSFENATKECLDEIIRDECGAKVVGSLITALKRVSEGPAVGVLTKFSELILDHFEFNPALLRHHVGSRLLSIVAINCGEAGCQRVLKILRGECASEDDAFELLKDRHAAATLTRLLSVHQDETSAWLSDLLRITSPSIPSSTGQAKKKIKKDDACDSLTTERIERIRFLVEDPIASPVIHAIVSDSNRLTLFKALTFSTILEAKRLSRFFNAILDVTADSSPLATQLLETVLFDETNSAVFMDSIFDSVCNFTAQKVLCLIPKADDRISEFHRRVMDLVSPKILEMTRHNIASHVVVSLVEVSSKIHDHGKSFRSVVDALCRSDTTFDLIRDKHSSLVVRKIIEYGAQITNKNGGLALLFSTIEQHITSLMYDSVGNLIVQQMIKASGHQGASTLFKKYLRGEEVLAACQHPSASHVVFTLMECVDPQTLADLCGTLKPHVITLAKHINGRFIVEKMIPLQRDIRETLIRQYVPLSLSKGTQHVLVLLFNAIDNQTRQNLIQNILLPQMRSLATNATSSIVIQKLLQSSPGFLAAAKKWASTGTALRDLSQDFFGKFVAQIITNSA